MTSIDKLVEIKHKKIKVETIIHYLEIGDLCGRPYQGHPNGCPSLDKCKAHDIPPFEDVYDHYYLVYGKFNREGYRKHIGKNDNTRWWQATLKNLLRDYIKELYKNNDSFYVYTSGSGTKFIFQFAGSMEWSHINVFSTMKLNGVKLDLKPRNKVIFCNLLCSKTEIRFNNGKQLTLEGF